ncbi:hypothetical protein GCM10020331_006080 [Ectobacillus funiculus]
MPKGGGSENMSAMKFLLPGEGVEGVKKFVLDTIIAAGGRACPPIVVGVGIGGSFDKVTEIAKKAILRDIGQYHPEPHIAQLEKKNYLRKLTRRVLVHRGWAEQIQPYGRVLKHTDVISQLYQ